MPSPIRIVAAAAVALVTLTPRGGLAAITCTVDNVAAPTSATCVGSGARENVVIDAVAFNLRHTFGAAFVNEGDWDSTAPGVQILTAGADQQVVLSGNGGGDTVRIGSTDAPASMLGTRFTVTGGDDGLVDTVILDDRDTSVAHTYLVQQNALQVEFTTVSYDKIEAITLNTGDFVMGGSQIDDTVNVASTHPNATTSVNAGTGKDSIVVGDPVSALDGIQGPVVVDGGPGGDPTAFGPLYTVSCPGVSRELVVLAHDRLTIADGAHAVAGHYTVTPTSVQRDGTALVTYVDVEDLILAAGSANDRIDAVSTLSNGRTILQGNGGDDEMAIADTGPLARLEAVGGANGDTIAIDNVGTGAVVTMFSEGQSESPGANTLVLRGARQGSGVRILGNGGPTTIRVEGAEPGAVVAVRPSNAIPHTPETTDTVFYAGPGAVQGILCEERGMMFPPAIFELSPAGGDENAGSAAVTITRSGDTSRAEAVVLQVGDGTAVVGDYVAGSFTVEFAAGETSKTVPVALIDDVLVEDAETVSLRLAHAFVGPADTSALTIADDDTGRPAFAVKDAKGKRKVVFTISLAPRTKDRTTVRYTTANGSATDAVDYLARGGTLKFRPRQRRKRVAVRLLRDATSPEEKTFFLRLSEPSGAVLLDPEGIGTIPAR